MSAAALGPWPCPREMADSRLDMPLLAAQHNQRCARQCISVGTTVIWLGTTTSCGLPRMCVMCALELRN
jgi:hypothetical protein